MIFVRDKFCFVHIFRSAGLAVTSALLRGVGQREEFLASTYARYDQRQPWRHSTAQEIRDAVGDGEFDAVFKFAVARNPFDVFESFARLCRLDLENFQGTWDPAWLATCRTFADQPLDVAIRREFWFLAGSGGLWDFHTSSRDDVMAVRFESMAAEWPTVLAACRMPPTCALPQRPESQTAAGPTWTPAAGDKLLLGTDGGYLILDPNQAFPTSGIEYTLRADSPQYTIEEE